MARKNSNFFHWLSIRKLRYEKLKNIKKPEGYFKHFFMVFVFQLNRKSQIFQFFYSAKKQTPTQYFSFFKIVQIQIEKVYDRRG